MEKYLCPVFDSKYGRFVLDIPEVMKYGKSLVEIVDKNSLNLPESIELFSKRPHFIVGDYTDTSNNLYLDIMSNISRIESGQNLTSFVSLRNQLSHIYNFVSKLYNYSEPNKIKLEDCGESQIAVLDQPHDYSLNEVKRRLQERFNPDDPDINPIVGDWLKI